MEFFHASLSPCKHRVFAGSGADLDAVFAEEAFEFFEEDVGGFDLEIVSGDLGLFMLIPV